MEVTNGCSTEFAKWKASVTLEEPEFLALCVEHGLDPGKFTVSQKYVFMWDSTEVLLGLAKVMSGQWPDAVKARERAVETQKMHVEQFKKIQATI